MVRANSRYAAEETVDALSKVCLAAVTPILGSCTVYVIMLRLRGGSHDAGSAARLRPRDG